jgi:hypothetical protein
MKTQPGANLLSLANANASLLFTPDAATVLTTRFISSNNPVVVGFGDSSVNVLNYGRNKYGLAFDRTQATPIYGFTTPYGSFSRSLTDEQLSTGLFGGISYAMNAKERIISLKRAGITYQQTSTADIFNVSKGPLSGHLELTDLGNLYGVSYGSFPVVGYSELTGPFVRYARGNVLVDYSQGDIQTAALNLSGGGLTVLLTKPDKQEQQAGMQVALGHLRAQIGGTAPGLREFDLTTASVNLTLLEDRLLVAHALQAGKPSTTSFNYKWQDSSAGVLNLQLVRTDPLTAGPLYEGFILLEHKF